MVYATKKVDLIWISFVMILLWGGGVICFSWYVQQLSSLRSNFMLLITLISARHVLAIWDCSMVSFLPFFYSISGVVQF